MQAAPRRYVSPERIHRAGQRVVSAVLFEEMSRFLPFPEAAGRQAVTTTTTALVRATPLRLWTSSPAVGCLTFPWRLLRSFLGQEGSALLSCCSHESGLLRGHTLPGSENCSLRVWRAFWMCQLRLRLPARGSIFLLDLGQRSCCLFVKEVNPFAGWHQDAAFCQKSC